MKKYWYIAIHAPIFLIIEVGMDMFLTKYMQLMVDDGISIESMDNIIHYGLIMIGILVLGVAGGMLSNIFTNISCYKFGNDLRKAVFNKFMDLSIHQADKFKTGSLVTRVTNDITQIQNMIAMCLRGLIRSASFFVLGIIFTLSISKNFGGVLLVVLPLEIVLMNIFMAILFPVFKKIQDKLDKVNTVVLENVQGSRVVKAFSKEQNEYNRFVGVNYDYTEKVLFVSKFTAFLSPLLNLIVYGGQIIIYNMGGTVIVDAFKNGITPILMVGQITQTITYITMTCMSLLMLGMTFTMIARADASASRINEVLDEKLELIDGNLDIALIEVKDKGAISFEHVSFGYPGAKEDILKDLNFKVKKGETIAVVGSTGCGKSTLVNLMVLLFDTKSGTVYINGHEVKEYKKEDLHKIVAICLQKAELFAGTIEDNIAFGKPDATLDEIKWAARVAQAEEFILGKDEGYQEVVTEKGTSLSGGQKQRMSIARAILRKPEFLIFDDSKSARDLVTEAKLYQAMKADLSYVTKIIVAQRLATAKNADRILVLDKGVIESFGTRDELMENSLVYKDIYLSQLKREEE
jgi:ATP-binding cassette subfamily B protein